MYIPLLNDDAPLLFYHRVRCISYSSHEIFQEYKKKKWNKYTVDEYNNKWAGVITGVILCRTFLRRDKCFSMDIMSICPFYYYYFFFHIELFKYECNKYYLNILFFIFTGFFFLSFLSEWF